MFLLSVERKQSNAEVLTVKIQGIGEGEKETMQNIPKLCLL